jgi:hypothetical protein
MMTLTLMRQQLLGAVGATVWHQQPAVATQQQLQEGVLLLAVHSSSSWAAALQEGSSREAAMGHCLVLVLLGQWPKGALVGLLLLALAVGA